MLRTVNLHLTAEDSTSQPNVGGRNLMVTSMLLDAFFAWTPPAGSPTCRRGPGTGTPTEHHHLPMAGLTAGEGSGRPSSQAHSLLLESDATSATSRNILDVALGVA